jgi:hypothetical protein
MSLITEKEADVKRSSNTATFRKLSQNKNIAAHLSAEDRRLLLISSLSLFLRRARHGICVTPDDLIRLVPYADSPSDIGAAA